MKKCTALFLLLFAVTLFWINPAKVSAMSALEQQLYEAAKKEGELQWWDTLTLKEAGEIITIFEKKYPGIKIKYFEGTTDVLEEKCLAEAAANRHKVDFLQIELYDRFKEKGLVANLSDVIKDTGFPVEYCSKDLDAVTLEHTLFGAAYNTKKLPSNMVPRSWEELLDPKYKGMVNVESRMKFFITITPAWGEEKVKDYLRKLSKQNPTFTKGGTHTMMLLGVGEFPIALNMAVHATRRAAEQGAPVAYLPLDVADKLSPHIVPSKAPNPNAAKLFVHWYLSKEGQLHVDQSRHKGNPLPGSGTETSEYVKKLGIKVYPTKSWELDYNRLEKEYQAAVGFSKEKLKTKKKKK